MPIATVVEIVVVALGAGAVYGGLRVGLKALVTAVKQNTETLEIVRGVLAEIRTTIHQNTETLGKVDNVIGDARATIRKGNNTLARIEEAMTRHEQENIRAHTVLAEKLENLTK